MLRRGTVQELVKLHSLVRCSASLVLRCRATQPEEDVVDEMCRAVALDFLGVQDDIRVTLMEASVLLARPGHNLEVFDTPDEEAYLGADRAVVPCRFTCRGLVLDFV